MDKKLQYSIIAGIFILSFSALWYVYEYQKSKPVTSTFTVTGEGKEIVVPNVAEIRIGIITEGQDLVSMQKENTEKMNKIIKFLKEKGIDEKDIQTTNYSVNPKYDYSKAPYKIIGYTINQELRVKIRDLNKINEILSQAVNYGANNVSGPTFTVDDEKIYLDKAREKAIQDAIEKAQKISKLAGFKLGRIISISEMKPGEIYPMPLMLKEAGGAGAEIPQVQPGSNEIKLQVNITFEIK